MTRAGNDSLLDGLWGYGLYQGKRPVPWDIWAPADRGEAAQILWNVAGLYLEPRE